MGEFEEKLNSVLSSPETMAQIMELASALGGNDPQQPPPSREEKTPENETSEWLTGFGDLLGGADPKMVSRIIPLLREYQRGGDEKAALLGALRPFLSEQRRGKVDRAIQITRLTRVIRSGMQMFRGDADV